MVGNPIQQIAQMLTETYSECQLDADNSTANAVVQGKWAHHQLVYRYHEEEKIIKVVCGFELRVPPARHGDVFNLVGLLNLKFKLGFFGFDNGIDFVGFHITLYSSAGEFTDDEYRDAAHDVLQTVDAYYPAFMRLIWGERTPEEAIRMVEELQSSGKHS